MNRNTIVKTFINNKFDQHEHNKITYFANDQLFLPLLLLLAIVIVVDVYVIDKLHNL